MRRALLVLLLLSACGQEAAPEEVTPGIGTSGTGVAIDISGEGAFGVVGGS